MICPIENAKNLQMFSVYLTLYHQKILKISVMYCWSSTTTYSQHGRKEPLSSLATPFYLALSAKTTFKTWNFYFVQILRSDSHLSKEFLFIWFNESPLKIMKNFYYFILKALFVLKKFKFLSWNFGYVEETA